MKDFSFWEEYEGTPEGSGRSEKIWLINPDTGQTGLFKFKKDISTTDHVSECIAYDLANIIGIPCAKFEVGLYKGREGSMSYSIVDNKEETLIEGIYCISLQYEHFDTETLMDSKTKDKYSLEMIQKALEPLGLFYDFLPVCIFDFLIGNLTFTLLGGNQIRKAVAVRTFVGPDCCDGNHYCKNGRNNKTRHEVKLAHGGNTWDELAVFGFVNQLAKEHKKTGHQGKNGQKAKQNSFNQHR